MMSAGIISPHTHHETHYLIFQPSVHCLISTSVEHMISRKARITAKMFAIIAPAHLMPSIQLNHPIDVSQKKVTTSVGAANTSSITPNFLIIRTVIQCL